MRTPSLLLACLLGVHLASAQAPATQVAVFKNGTAFFNKQAEVAAANGTAVLAPLPSATFGTFWLGAEGNSIRQVRSAPQPATEWREANTLADLLRANLGKRVSLHLPHQDRLVTGTLLKTTAEMALLQTEAGTAAVPLAELGQVNVLGQEAATRWQAPTEEPALHIDLADKKAQQSLQISYLTQHITWLPEYHIELLNDKEAQVSLNAVLMNDAEDLQNAQVSLVVGSPNFTYNHLAAPLLSAEGVENFLARLNGGYASGRRARADIAVQSMANVALDASFDNNFVPMEASGDEAEDLFFYKAQSLTLPKGGRALLPLFAEKASFEHIYETELTPREVGYAAPGEAENRPREVWHSISLKNEGKQPWTTGTALVSQRNATGPRPIAQDKLNYTPPGALSKVRLTLAPNVFVKDTEEEIERKEGSKQKDGYYYDLVTVQGKVEIKNFKAQAIKLQIVRDIKGEPKQSSTTWQLQKLPRYADTYNGSYCLRWHIDLKPGEAQELNYQYQFLMRR